MKLSTKAIFLIIGVFLTLLGGYLTWTALYPGTGEFQELSVPDYISGNSIKVSVHYPLRVLIGKSSQVRVKFSAGEGLIPGSALDQELDLPGFVVTPQKRQMTSVSDGQKGSSVWKIAPTTPAEIQGVISLALESAPNGMFAISPTVQASFMIKACRLLGMEYLTLIKVGLACLLIGGLAIMIALKFLSAQPRATHKPKIYG
ncbi:MAG TPA: hypothetical protein PKK82_05575 [Anaerolineaceae bacterium]|nr:hypothetical protein [Chloroflexota bacterium]HNY84312.1 hypothetical protein [Anaerolineaceae bacterium]